MITVSVEKNILHPGGIESSAIVERNEQGRLVRLVAVDYQLPGRRLSRVALRYAAMHGFELGAVDG